MMYKKLVVLFMAITLIAGCGILRQGILTAEKPQTPEPAKAASAPDAAMPAPQSVDIKNSESMFIVFITPPETVKNLAPAPLVPSPYNIMYVAVSRRPASDPAGYDHSMEMGVLVVFKGKMYAHPVYSVVDNKAMSEGMRAITGSPARMGKIHLDQKGNHLVASVEREGKILFKADMVLGEPGEPLDNTPGVILKIVPAAQNNAQPAEKKLISGKIENMKVHSLIDGEVAMEFDQSMTDGFPKVKVQQIFRSVFRKADFTMTSAGVVHDYLKAD